jgi:hypothetical protein
MAKTINAPKILVTNPEGKRPLGRLRCRWRIIPKENLNKYGTRQGKSGGLL